MLIVHVKAETELIGLTKRVRNLEEDFETTESRLHNISTKLDEATQASDENERYDSFRLFYLALYRWCRDNSPGNLPGNLQLPPHLFCNPKRSAETTIY